MTISIFSTSKLSIFGLCVFALNATANPTNPDFNALWLEVDSFRKAAGIQGHEWRDTAKILLGAKEEFKVGNSEKAFVLLSKARAESIAALAQATREKKSWKRRVIK
jgi:tryptophan 2,3-dioxygenase